MGTLTFPHSLRDHGRRIPIGLFSADAHHIKAAGRPLALRSHRHRGSYLSSHEEHSGAACFCGPGGVAPRPGSPVGRVGIWSSVSFSMPLNWG